MPSDTGLFRQSMGREESLGDSSHLPKTDKKAYVAVKQLPVHGPRTSHYPGVESPCPAQRRSQKSPNNDTTVAFVGSCRCGEPFLAQLWASGLYIAVILHWER